MSAVLEKTEVPGVTRPLTYEEYLAAPVDASRYDILGGYKVYRLYGEKQLPGPTTRHQEIQGNLYVLLRAFAKATNIGKAILAPRDVMVTLEPLHTRQPDVLLISRERLARNAPADDPAPLAPAPELVVEIVSPSDRPSVLDAKIADYRAVGSQEVWIVRSGPRAVEVKWLTREEIATLATYAEGESVASRAFPGLVVSVDALFEE